MNSIPAAVLDAAIEWQLCLSSGNASDKQRSEFALWLAMHPDHATVWQQLNGLDTHLSAAMAHSARQALLVKPRRLPRAAGAGLLGILLSAGLLFGLHQYRPLGDYLADELTAPGEHRELRLADRSQVWLNSATAVDIDFDAQQRRLRLRSGEILVDTASDTRPFIVDTAQGSLRALGTRFLVRREGAATRLTVLESAVAVQPGAGRTRQVVRAGEQVMLGPEGLGPIQPAALAADAWSRGMLVVENQRLAELIATLNDYRPGYLELDPALANLRITGSFPLRDSDKALAALPPSLPVRIEQPNRWWTRIIPATD